VRVIATASDCRTIALLTGHHAQAPVLDHSRTLPQVCGCRGTKKMPRLGRAAGAIVPSDANDNLNSDCLCLDHRDDIALCFRVGAAARGAADARADSARVLAAGAAARADCARVLADAAAFGAGHGSWIP